jgi:hypothetical protein
MATPNPAVTNQTREALQAMAALSAQVVKMAGVLNAKQAAAPKAADKDQLTKTAAALVDLGFANGLTKEAVEKQLADPTVALTALENLADLAHKQAAGDGRLANGKVTEKVAMSDLNPFGSNFNESEADAAYIRRMSAYQHNGRA